MCVSAIYVCDMCPHTRRYVFMLLYECAHTAMCPHTPIYTSVYFYLCVLILLCVCPHTPIYMCSYCYTCAHTSVSVRIPYCLSAYRPMQRFAVPAPRQCHACLILLYMCPHTLLYMCPHTICPHTGRCSALRSLLRDSATHASFCHICFLTLHYICVLTLSVRIQADTALQGGPRDSATHACRSVICVLTLCCTCVLICIRVCRLRG
jgi:hypothetical protein